MADQRSDVWGLNKWLLATVLAASMFGGGCAGLVTGANSGSGAAPATTTPPPQGQPQLSATPMSASFPGVATGSTSSQTITLQNAGTAQVTISSANVAGAGFSTAGLTLPISIAPGQNTTFNVVFAPSSAGNATGSVSLLSNAPNSPLSISANGSSVASTATLSVNPGSLDFGTVVVGSTSSLGVTLTNTGNASLSITSLAATGPGFGATGVSGGLTVAPGQTAIISATFAPTAAGAAAGALAVVSNAGSVSVPLAGSGGQLSTHTVALSWDASTSDVIGYYVYRGLPDGSFAKINSAPLVLTSFTDSTVVSGLTYTYVVTSVDADNVESDYSDPAVAVIP